MEVSLLCARLSLSGPLHISSGREDPESSGEIFHSDTLTAAMVAAGLELFEDFHPGDFIDSFIPSSAFPWFRKELFFPKPMSLFPFTYAGSDADVNQNKKLKKLTYLGKSYFEKVLEGQEVEIPASHQLDKGVFLSDKVAQEDILIQNRKTSIIGKELQQRVSLLNRTIEGDPRTFYLERVFFHPEGGIYILFYNPTAENPSEFDEAFKKRLGTLLRYLGEKGLGKNRTFGFGQFDFKDFETITIKVPENCTHWMNFSLYCPKGKSSTDTELNHDVLRDASYQLIKRGGWLSDAENPRHLSLRKKSVYMFQEGSVLNWGQKEKGIWGTGKLVDLRPSPGKKLKEFSLMNHPVWRDGRAIFFPIRQ